MSERDQRNAARKVENLRARIMQVADLHGGRLFNTAGDGFMLEFASAGSALGAIQDILDKRGKKEPPIRVGAHVGDVVVTATEDLLGHGVNVAARLQELAEAGTALVSAEFRSMARSSPTAAFQSRGQKPLDNIEQRVQTFEILSKRQRYMRGARRVGAGVVAASVLGVGLYFSPVLLGLVRDYLPQEPEAVAEAPTQLETLTQEVAQVPAFQAGQVLRDCDNCPEVTVLAGGLFVMGSPAGETGRAADEGPQREVSVAPFAIGTSEVTFQQWDACLAGGGCNGFSPADRGWGRGNRPVIGVSWADAQAYLDWLNAQAGGLRYRLPTEAEWEYAARAGAADAYAFGARLTAENATFRAQQTTPVDARTPNAFGLHDMHGNAAEWVEDCYVANYNVAPVDGAAVQGDPCGRRVYRGGAYSDQAVRLRSSARASARPDQRLPGAGFRVVRALD